MQPGSGSPFGSVNNRAGVLRGTPPCGFTAGRVFANAKTIVAPLNDGDEIERGNVVARWTGQGTDRHGQRISTLT